MCTAISLGNYFGRTLDLEYSYNETVAVMPRNFPFSLRNGDNIPSHFAIIGMAAVADGFPLFYDAMNERGLCAAGLNFPQSAYYPEEREGAVNIATFELIPYILGKCESVMEATRLIKEIHICNTAFSSSFPATPLHWIFADKESSITVEVCRETRIYENSVGVLTNEPPFPMMMEHIKDFKTLTPFEPPVPVESRGSGAVGLPGDWSSRSRFVRAAFVAKCSLPSDSEHSEMAEFFRALSAVEVPRGTVRLQNGKNVISYYSSCMDKENGIYAYKTYENPRITAVSLKTADLSGEQLAIFPLRRATDILFEN